MKINTHPVSGWLWISNQDNRLSYSEFIKLVQHLKATFKAKLSKYEGQPVYTYNTDQVTLNNAVEGFISSL